MKHLKPYSRYNESMTQELPEGIKSNLEDICLDLTDDHSYQITIGFRNYKNNMDAVVQDDYAYLKIEKGRWIPFYYKEVEDVVERVKDYMKMEGFIVGVKLCRDHVDERNGRGSYWIDDSDEKGDQIVSVLVHFDEPKINEFFNEAKRIYQIQEIPKDIITEIRDICLDLTDIGIKIRFDNFSKKNDDTIYKELVLYKTKHDEDYAHGEVTAYFDLDDNIKDVIERITDYMYQHGYSTNVRYTRKFLHMGEEKIGDGQMMLITMTFDEITHNESILNHDLEKLLTKEVMNDIDDICLELTDNGLLAYNTAYRYGGGSQTRFNIVIKHKNNIKFEIDDASDVIFRLIHYMKQYKYSAAVGIEHVISEVDTDRGPMPAITKLVGATQFFNGTMNFENISGMKFYKVIVGFTCDEKKNPSSDSITPMEFIKSYNESMKHLKRYNEGEIDFPEFKPILGEINFPESKPVLYVTEIPVEIHQDLNDICQELKDEGFNCNLVKQLHRIISAKNGVFTGESIVVYMITKNYLDFAKKTIEETIERIKDYMDKNGYITHVRYDGSDAKFHYGPICSYVEIKFIQK